MDCSRGEGAGFGGETGGHLFNWMYRDIGGRAEPLVGGDLSLCHCCCGLRIREARGRNAGA